MLQAAARRVLKAEADTGTPADLRELSLLAGRSAETAECAGGCLEILGMPAQSSVGSALGVVRRILEVESERDARVGTLGSKSAKRLLCELGDNYASILKKCFSALPPWFNPADCADLAPVQPSKTDDVPAAQVQATRSRSRPKLECPPAEQLEKQRDLEFPQPSMATNPDAIACMLGRPTALSVDVCADMLREWRELEERLSKAPIDAIIEAKLDCASSQADAELISNAVFDVLGDLMRKCSATTNAFRKRALAPLSQGAAGTYDARNSQIATLMFDGLSSERDKAGFRSMRATRLATFAAILRGWGPLPGKPDLSLFGIESFLAGAITEDPDGLVAAIEGCPDPDARSAIWKKIGQSLKAKNRSSAPSSRRASP